MRIVAAFASALVLTAIALPAAAQSRGFKGEFISPLPASVTKISVEFADDIVNDSMLNRRYRNPHSISSKDAEELSSRFTEIMQNELRAVGMYHSSGAGHGLRMVVHVVAIAPSDPGMTDIGFRYGLDAGTPSRGGATFTAELRDVDGELVGSFAFSGRDNWANTTGVSSGWRGAETTFSRFAHRIAEVMKHEGNGSS